jgi:hypothetical protein
MLPPFSSWTHLANELCVLEQTDSVQYSGAYMAYGVDNSLRLEDFCKNLRVEIISLNEEDIEFDLIGIDAAVANAFRRILIAEVCSLLSLFRV